MKDAKFINAPALKPWVKRWLLRSAKLALVVGIVGAGYDAWTRLTKYEETRASMMQSEIGYRCAASLSDDTLSGANTNGYTIDISRLGCAAEPFFVSMQEARDMRVGKLKFDPSGIPFSWLSSVMTFASFALMSLAVTSACIFSVVTALWVWR